MTCGASGAGHHRHLSRWLLLLNLLLLLALPAVSHAGIPLVDASLTGPQFPLDRYSVWLADPDHNLQPEELLRGERDDLLIDNDGHSYNFGLSNSTYWLLFELTWRGNEENTNPLTRLLEINYPPLDHISLFHFDRAGKLVELASGDNLPFRQRQVMHNGYLFPLQLHAGETKRFLLKVESGGSIRVPLTLWEPDYFHEHNRTFLLLFGTYFGIVALMFIYNLILYLFIRDNTYLYYILYIASFMFFQSSYNGFAFQYLWPDLPALNNAVVNPSIFLVLIFGSQFSRKVLETGTTLKSLDRILRWMIIGCVLMTGLCLVASYATMLYLALLSMLLSVIAIMVAACINSWRGIRTAQLFLLAWFTIMLGAILLGSVVAGLIPANIVTTNAVTIGSAIEVTLLSLSLAHRMHHMERDRTRAEQESKQALMSVNLHLQESNRIKDEFLSTISHEMRTPMHGVLSSLDHLRQQGSDSKGETFLDSAEHSARQMMLLIDSVLDYTELQAGAITLERESFTITRLTSSLTQLFQPQAQAKGLLFSIDVQADVPDLVIGDFRHTRQILVNLLSNAVKFTQQGFVRLTVSVASIDHRTTRARLEFKVTDSGIGILHEMAPVIFDRFRQQEGGFSRGFGGLGIGLATSREIARQMKADLNFTSTPGAGSTFSLVMEFPFSSRSVPARNAERLPHDWQELAHGRLALIVEDNAVNQMALKASLLKLGLRTLLASNGREAVDAVLQHPVDIVLMDCQMPEMDGFDATRAIRQLASDRHLVPIIAITANAMSKDRERCVSAGMNDYMSKPVNLNELKEKLLKWLPLRPATCGIGSPES